jgi:hypothetical protein
MREELSRQALFEEIPISPVTKLRREELSRQAFEEIPVSPVTELMREELSRQAFRGDTDQSRHGIDKRRIIPPSVRGDNRSVPSRC